MPKCDPGSCRLVLYSFIVHLRRGQPVRIPAGFDSIKAGITRLVPEVEPPGPTEISALMVPAFDYISRDVFLVPGFMPVLDARFHCRSRLFQIRWNHRLYYPQTTFSAPKQS